MEFTRAAAFVFVVHIQSSKPQAGHRIISVNPRATLEAADKNAVSLRTPWSVASKTLRSTPQPLYRLVT